MSQFNKKVGAFIDNDKVDKYQKNWKKTGIKTQSSFIGADIILAQLARPGAVGIRIHYGIDDEGNVQPILFAADDKGKDIKVSDGKDAPGSGGADASTPCPPFCPEP